GVEDHEPRPSPELARELVGVEDEVVLLAKRQWYGHGSCEPDRRLVDREPGVGVDDLVAGIADGQDREEEKRLRARADEHASGRDRQCTACGEVLGGRLAKLGYPGGWAVGGVPGPHLLGSRLADVGPRRPVGRA